MNNDYFYKKIRQFVTQYLNSQSNLDYFEQDIMSEATKEFLSFEFDTEEESIDSDATTLPIALFTYCLTREQINPNANRLYELIMKALMDKEPNDYNYEASGHYNEYFCGQLKKLLKKTLDANPTKIVDPALFIKDIEHILNKLFSKTNKGALDKAKVLLDSGFIDYLAKNDKEPFAKEMLLNHWLILLKNNILTTEQKINEKDFGDYYHLYLSKETRLTPGHINNINNIPDDRLVLLYKKGIHTQLAQMLAKELQSQSPWLPNYSKPIPDYQLYHAAIKKIMAAKPSDAPEPPLSDDMKIINSFLKNSTDIKSYIDAPASSEPLATEFTALDSFFKTIPNFFKQTPQVKLGTQSAANSQHWQVASTYILAQAIRNAAIEASLPYQLASPLVEANSPFRHLKENKLTLSEDYQAELSSAIPSAFSGLYVSDSIFKAFDEGKIENTTVTVIVNKFIMLDKKINYFLTSFGLDFKKIIFGTPMMSAFLSSLLMDLLKHATAEQREALQQTTTYKTLAADEHTQSIAVYEDKTSPPPAISDFLREINQAAHNYAMDPRHGLKYLFTSGNTSNIECARNVMNIYEDKALHARLPEMLRVIIKYRLTSYKEKKVTDGNETRKYEKKFYTYLLPILTAAPDALKTELKKYKLFPLTIINSCLSYLAATDYADPEKARSLKDSIDLFFNLCDIKPDDLLVKAGFTYDDLQRKTATATASMVLTSRQTPSSTSYWLNSFNPFNASSASSSNSDRDDSKISAFEMLGMQ